jgi:hypothetical protein
LVPTLGVGLVLLGNPLVPDVPLEYPRPLLELVPLLLEELL